MSSGGTDDATLAALVEALAHHYALALAILERVLGADHPAAAGVRVNLANAWLGAGEIGEAERIIARGPDLAHALGPDRPDVGIAFARALVHEDRSRAIAEAEVARDVRISSFELGNQCPER